MTENTNSRAEAVAWTLKEYFGSSNDTTFTAREAGRQAAAVAIKTLAASPTPPEAVEVALPWPEPDRTQWAGLAPPAPAPEAAGGHGPLRQAMEIKRMMAAGCDMSSALAAMDDVINALATAPDAKGGTEDGHGN